MGAAVGLGDKRAVLLRILNNRGAKKRRLEVGLEAGLEVGGWEGEGNGNGVGRPGRRRG